MMEREQMTDKLRNRCCEKNQNGIKEMSSIVKDQLEIQLKENIGNQRL